MPCPQDASAWNKTTHVCYTPCTGNTFRAETGECREANSTNCRAPRIFIRNETGPYCIECDAEKGFIYSDGNCKCDPAKHLRESEDETCACYDSAPLVYNEAVGECLCEGNVNMTFVEGNFDDPQCEAVCPSGVFDYERPYACVDSCPSSMVLYNTSGRLLCGQCDGYV